MPFDVNVRDLATALTVVGDVPNAGLAIDTWHMAKLGIAPDELRDVPAGRIGWVELSDGQYEDMADPIDEVVNHRKLPGEGEFSIREYVAACRDQGYEGPWGVEVLSEELRNLPIAEIFDRSHETASAQLAPERSAHA
jgi:sugar phosphate isomerase/epimerase